MTKENVNPDGKSIRELAGTGKRHVIPSAAEKEAVDCLLNMTPAALAEIIVTRPASPHAAIINTMVTRDILNAQQCALLSAEIANRYENMRQIDVIRSKDGSLTGNILRHASGKTHAKLQEILTPRPDENGGINVLV